MSRAPSTMKSHRYVEAWTALGVLFVLAMHVSSTRLILPDGYASDIIPAFGDFIIGGNHVVGLVLVLILIAITFIVIAKGARRVAEVSARFTLDALPGKQMAIVMWEVPRAAA